MVDGGRRTPCIIRVHKADPIGFTALPVDTYTALFRLLDEPTASNMATTRAEEFTICAPSSSNVTALSEKIKSVLSAKRKRQYDVLLLEMLDRDADVDVYDDICEALYLAVDDSSTAKPWLACVAVSNPVVFRESVFLSHRLTPTCDKNNVGLILLSCAEQTIDPVILSQGTLPEAMVLTPLTTLPADAHQAGTGEERLSPDEVAEAFQVLFGHFKVKIGDAAYHVPAIASVRKLSKNTTFLTQLRVDVSRVLDSERFSIYPCGIPSGGIGQLCLALADGDASRLCELTTIKNHDGVPLVILCDFLYPMYPIAEAIEEARSKGIRVAIAAIASYKDSPKFNGVDTITYLDTNYESFRDGDASCPFCSQDVPIIAGEHFDDYARKVGQFEPFTFWEFIGQDREFYSVGHWPSDRTPNHYEFRIITAPLFRRFSFCLSVRFRNILIGSMGILPDFVRKIVCTEGEESTALSIALAEVLGLSSEDVIRVPRAYLNSVAGKDLDSDVQRHVESSYGVENIKRQTVLIVDQAAHRLSTLSSLRNICGFYDCVVLAFLVFVDRTDPAFSLGELLHDMHYVRLYSWPVTARMSHECPCIVG